MAKKYYVVRKGKTPGIYFTWEDCKQNIEGFSGAEYKGFMTLQEAEEYLTGAKSSDAPANEGQEISCDKNTAVAYVDGSYHVGTEEYAYGVVMFYEESK